MNGLTKFVLKRPLTAIMAVLCLIVFGYSSIVSTRTELTPEMNMPMMIVRTVYSGANPEDVDELVSKKLEDAVGALSGVKSVTSTSSESMSMVMIQYNYGQDIDEAYDDLKKKVDAAGAELPEGADEPVIIEMDSSSQADITLSVSNTAWDNQYSYVSNEIVPEFEKISKVAEVNIAGGSEDYIKIELIPDAMAQYHLSLSSIASDIAAAGVTMPGGAAQMGRKELSLSTRLDFDTQESLKNIPLTTQNYDIIYLGDVARIYTTHEKNGSIAHYNGQDTVSVMLTKQQSATATELSKEVTEVVESMMNSDPDLNIVVVNDSADDIADSIMSVAETLILAIIISMVVIWLFFGDLKASVIVGSSIPFSILAALILMKFMDFSLNMITMAALTMGVGMMVDNSIVVLESCFRVSEKKDKGLVGYTQAALEGTNIVGMSKAPLSAPINRLQDMYRRVMRSILPKRKTVMGTCIALLIVSFFLASKLGFQLISVDDQGQVLVSVELQPGMKTAQQAAILKNVEEQIADYQELESYITSMGENDAEAQIIAYLTDDRRTKTADVVKLWKNKLSTIPDCNITVEENSQVSGMNMDTDSYELILQGADYEELKHVSGDIVNALMERDEVTRIHSTLENSAPIVEVYVDAVKAKAVGARPSAVGASVYEATNGSTPATLTVNGNEVDVKVEYPDDVYRTVDQIKNMVLTLPGGNYVALNEIADVHFKDSPSSISKKNKQYMVTITGDYTEFADKNTTDNLKREVVNPNLTSGVTMGVSSAMEMQGDEMSSLMLVGTVVNAGILYVDTVSQYRLEMKLDDALIEAGATRLRPILMTTLTTIVSMIPMALAMGNSGQMIQGLAIVNIGGLTASTLLSLLMLPVYYSIMSGNKKKERGYCDD